MTTEVDNYKFVLLHVSYTLTSLHGAFVGIYSLLFISMKMLGEKQKQQRME